MTERRYTEQEMELGSTHTIRQLKAKRADFTDAMAAYEMAQNKANEAALNVVMARRRKDAILHEIAQLEAQVNRHRNG